MKNLLFFLVLILFIYSSYSESEKKVFIKDITLKTNAFEDFSVLNIDFNTFKSNYKNMLVNYFKELQNLDKSYLLSNDQNIFDLIIEPVINKEGDNLKFGITLKDNKEKVKSDEKFFFIDVYEDKDKINAKIEYNTKSIFYECFGIYWLYFVKGKEKGISAAMANEIKKQYYGEILKTKKGLIFDKEKNKKIAEELEEKECYEAECLQEIAPFLYLITIDFEKTNEGKINTNVELSKGGNTYRSSKFNFSETEFERSFNENKTLTQITDSAFDIMDVYNLPYFNDKLLEIKNIAGINGNFVLAKQKLDELSKKFDKEEFRNRINEYSDFLINAEKSMIDVKKNNPLPVFPAVFGVLTAGAAATGGVFTYFYFDDKQKKEIAYNKYNTATVESDVIKFKNEYKTNLDLQNRDMIIFISAYSGAGLSLIIMIIGVSVQAATINNTKNELKHKALKLTSKVSFDINHNFKDNLCMSFGIKF